MVEADQRSDVANPYEAPQPLAAQAPESAMPRPGLRFRFIPAVLLWVLSALILAVCLFALGALVFAHVYYVWIERDPESLDVVQQEVTNPPIVAAFLSGLAAGVCGMLGGTAWMRGRWRRAILLSAAFVLLFLFSKYVSGDL